MYLLYNVSSTKQKSISNVLWYNLTNYQKSYQRITLLTLGFLPPTHTLTVCGWQNLILHRIVSSLILLRVLLSQTGHNIHSVCFNFLPAFLSKIIVLFPIPAYQIYCQHKREKLRKWDCKPYARYL